MDWTTPISHTNIPPGADVFALEHNDNTVHLIGRIIDKGQRCSDPDGCGQPGTVTVYRCPTTGLNMPGQAAPVNVIRWCGNDGQIGCMIDDARGEELAWGWNHTEVC